MRILLEAPTFAVTKVTIGLRDPLCPCMLALPYATMTPTPRLQAEPCAVRSRAQELADVYGQPALPRPSRQRTSERWTLSEIYGADPGLRATRARSRSPPLTVATAVAPMGIGASSAAVDAPPPLGGVVRRGTQSSPRVGGWVRLCLAMNADEDAPTSLVPAICVPSLFSLSLLQFCAYA